MASAKRYLIHVPAFSEHLFRLFMSATDADKAGLSEYERTLLKDRKSIQDFVTCETLEKLLFVASKMGYELSLSIGPTTEAIEAALNATEYQYDSDYKRLDSISAISRAKVSTMSSREIMITSIMCAQNCNMEAHRLTSFTSNMVEKRAFMIKEPFDMNIFKATEAVLTVNKLLLEQLNSLAYWKEMTELDEFDLRILSALFSKKDSALSAGNLVVILRVPSKKRIIVNALERMALSGLVVSDRKPGDKKMFNAKPNYIISTKGIEKIMKYIYYVWQKGFEYQI